MDWEKSDEHLREVEKEYTEIGTVGQWVLLFIIRPCKQRFESGERTRSLYDEIMKIK